MAGKETAEVQRAIARVIYGETLSAAARAESVAVTSVRRALRKRGEPPRAAGPAATPRRGETHKHLSDALAALRLAMVEGVRLGYGSEVMGKMSDAERTLLSILLDN